MRRTADDVRQTTSSQANLALSITNGAGAVVADRPREPPIDAFLLWHHRTTS